MSNDETTLLNVVLKKNGSVQLEEMYSGTVKVILYLRFFKFFKKVKTDFS